MSLFYTHPDDTMYNAYLDSLLHTFFYLTLVAPTTADNDEKAPETSINSEDKGSNNQKETVKTGDHKSDNQDTTQDTDANEPKRAVLTIICQTMKALLALIEDCMTGEINKQFKPVEDEVRKIKEYEDVTFKVVMYQVDLLKCFRELGKL